MEARFLPKVEGKQKEHGHSLLFDSAMTDRVLRLNAYEERMLLRRTEHIEKEKQQTLDEHNFSKSQFLQRFLPVVKRQNELRKEMLSKVYEAELQSCGEKAIVERNRPQSSFPVAAVRACTAKENVKPSLRRTVSAEMKFPALQESMDDILNGYRSEKSQPKSVSPTKMRLVGNWSLGTNYSNRTPVRHGHSSLKAATPKTKATSKSVDFCTTKDENIDHKDILNNNAHLRECPKMLEGKRVIDFTDKISVENFTIFPDCGDEMIDRKEAAICNLTEEKVSEQNERPHDMAKPTEFLNGDGVLLNERNFTLTGKHLKFPQKNDSLPENLLTHLVSTLENDATASHTSRFLAKMLNSNRHKSPNHFPCVKGNSANLVSLVGDTKEVHILSDVKQRQRQEAQRIRIMRTVMLAYDTVWNERAKKISTVA